MAKKTGAKKRIKNWVEKNPHRWYSAKFSDIQVETDVSESSLYREYALLVAQVANILPSEVLAKRREIHGTSPRLLKLTEKEVARIHELYDEGKTPIDIAFMTGRSLSQVEKYKPKKKTQK